MMWGPSVRLWPLWCWSRPRETKTAACSFEGHLLKCGPWLVCLCWKLLSFGKGIGVLLSELCQLLWLYLVLPASVSATAECSFSAMLRCQMAWTLLWCCMRTLKQAANELFRSTDVIMREFIFRIDSRMGTFGLVEITLIRISASVSDHKTSL